MPGQVERSLRDRDGRGRPSLHWRLASPLRLRSGQASLDGRGARPHTSRAACVRSYSLVRLRLRCTGLRFAGQDSAAFFDALPEVGIGGLPPAADIVRDAMLQH